MGGGHLSFEKILLVEKRREGEGQKEKEEEKEGEEEKEEKEERTSHGEAEVCALLGSHWQ